MKRINNIVFIIGLLLIVSQVPAHAYIDGGTGSYVMQIAVSVFLGMGYAFKNSIYRMFAKLKRNRIESGSKKDDQ